MNETAIKEKLDELREAMRRCPQPERRGRMGEGIYISDGEAEEASLEANLESLRLQVKYLLFDLEATRRENRYLRQMLESRPKPSTDEPKGDDSKLS